MNRPLTLYVRKIAYRATTLAGTSVQMVSVSATSE
jgi:hypothetical protein